MPSQKQTPFAAPTTLGDRDLNSHLRQSNDDRTRKYRQNADVESEATRNKMVGGEVQRNQQNKEDKWESEKEQPYGDKLKGYQLEAHDRHGRLGKEMPRVKKAPCSWPDIEECSLQNFRNLMGTNLGDREIILSTNLKHRDMENNPRFHRPHFDRYLTHTNLYDCDPQRMPLDYRDPGPPHFSLDENSMASKQTQRDSMSPAEAEQQDIWANQQIAFNGPCPAGFSWRRIQGGYRCKAGAHMMTDKLIQEGRGGHYVQQLEKTSRLRFNLNKASRSQMLCVDGDKWCGPHYSSARSLEAIPQLPYGMNNGRQGRR